MQMNRIMSTFVEITLQFLWYAFYKLLTSPAKRRKSLYNSGVQCSVYFFIYEQSSKYFGLKTLAHYVRVEKKNRYEKQLWNVVGSNIISNDGKIIETTAR